MNPLKSCFHQAKRMNPEIRENAAVWNQEIPLMIDLTERNS